MGIYQNNKTKWPNNHFTKQQADKIVIFLNTKGKISMSIKMKWFGFPQQLTLEFNDSDHVWYFISLEKGRNKQLRKLQ